MEKTNKNNIALALFLSFLICGVMAVVYGLIYYSGWISVWVSLATAMLGISVYGRFAKPNWFVPIWILVWIIVLNELAMLIAASLAVSSQLGCTFQEAWDFLLGYLSVDGEVKDLFWKDSLLNIFFAIIGVVAMFIIFKIKEKKLKKINEALSNYNTNQNMNAVTNQNNSNSNNIQTNSTSINENSYLKSTSNNEIYKLNFANIIKEIRKSLLLKDKKEFQTSIHRIDKIYFSNITKQEYDYYKEKIFTLSKNPKLTDEQKEVIRVFKEYFIN